MFSLNLSRIISIFLSSSIINLSYATGTGIQWVQLSTKMPINVSDMVATPIGNQIIITGGCSTGNYRLNPGDINFYCTEITNAAFAFTPAAQTFKTLPSMPRERYRHAAAVVNNKLYVIGGRDIHDNFVSPVDVWNPVTNQWTTPLTLPDAYLNSDNIAEAYKDVIFIAGGYTADYVALKRLVAWNVTSNTFYNKTSMSRARGDLGGAIVTTKLNRTMLYTVGGFTDVNNYCSPLRTVERYDIAADAWYSVADMLKGRGDMGVALLNQKIYTVAGETKTSTYCINNVLEDASSASLTVNDVESYDPNNNEFLSNPYSTSDSTPWVDENDLYQALFRSRAAAWPGTNTLYVFGGQEAYNNSCDCFLSSNNVYGFVDTNAVTNNTKSSASNAKHGTVFWSCAVSSLVLYLIYAW